MKQTVINQDGMRHIPWAGTRPDDIITECAEVLENGAYQMSTEPPTCLECIAEGLTKQGGSSDRSDDRY